MLNQWRAYVGKVFLLRDQIRETGHPLLDGGASGFRMRLSLDPSVFAVAMTSSYSWFSVTLRHAIEVLILQEPQPGFGNERQGQIFRSENQEEFLSVAPTEITPHVYLFSTDRGPVWLACSLSHGFASLRACMARWRAGSLWHADGDFEMVTSAISLLQ